VSFPQRHLPEVVRADPRRELPTYPRADSHQTRASHAQEAIARLPATTPNVPKVGHADLWLECRVIGT